jgi:16S rRNA (cytidine1402-2'-O)-methyltransferase
MAGNLYIVSTPIGNLEDITLRAIRVLKEAGVIAAEDTRHTRKLLSRYDIHIPLTSYHDHNKYEKAEILIAKMKEGVDIALVSDAGTPGISDPGYYLIKRTIEEGIRIIPIPGTTAFTTALSISGLSTDRFSFIGFLPKKRTARGKTLKTLSTIEHTLIIYESPYRVLKTLNEIREIFGERKVSVARELTKIHEEVIRGTVSKVIEKLGHHPKGEIVIIVEGKRKEEVSHET